MTRTQGVVYLKRVVVKPFIENLEWFFALYKDYRVIVEVTKKFFKENLHVGNLLVTFV